MSIPDTTRNAASISYPCVVLDIGASRLPKSFDRDDARSAIEGIAIFEAAIGLVEDRNSPLREKDIFVYDIQRDPATIKEFLEDVEELLTNCTVISHNAATDIKLLKGMCLLVGHRDFTDSIKSYCTMEHGTRFSTTHVYRGGKKVKKWPHLQELWRNLTGQDVGKGDILDDLVLCFCCFKEMELRDALEGASEESEKTGDKTQSG